jgi:PilZ domain
MRAAPPADLRQSQRIPATIPILVVLESDGFKVERQASTVDLSVRGVRVRVPFRLVPGELVGIITQGDSRQSIPSCVVWAQRERTDLWSLAGLAFLDTLPS